MLRRRFFLAAAGLFGWRVHTLARLELAGGGVLYLVLRGEPWKLTSRERELVSLLAKEMRRLDPELLQQEKL